MRAARDAAEAGERERAARERAALEDAAARGELSVGEALTQEAPAWRTQEEWQGKRWKAGEAILGRYVVEGELGQGGMGAVYACLDKVGGVKVAVKALPPEVGRNRAEMEAVRANFQLVGGLRHPNIVGVRTLEKDGQGEYFLVMDMAEGKSLREWMLRRSAEGGIPLEEAVPVLRQVAAALDYAHRMRVVHRDVKPGNVMVDSNGEAKVLDFGLASQIRASLSRVSRDFGGTGGTRPYMAPEQWEGRRQDARTDQYALAAMAYEMLAGYLPFEGEDPLVLREAVLHSDIEDIPGVSSGAMAALRRGMAKTRAERFESCAEFVDALAGENEAGTAATGPKEPAVRVAKEEAQRARRSGPSAGESKIITLPGGAAMEMVWCPPGKFMMGSPEEEEGRDNDETQHRVTLTKGFWMARTPVTQKQWKSVMGNNPSEFKGDDLPVECVSWNDCQEFCKKAGLGLRLPTEAEWEYACRAGSTGPYAGTGELEDMGWYDYNSGYETHPVGRKSPNAWGFCDMHGNVCEWCTDWYQDDLGSAAVTDPTGPATGGNRVLRGGSWCNSARICRSAFRFSGDPALRSSSSGFRPCSSAGLY